MPTAGMENETGGMTCFNDSWAFYKHEGLSLSGGRKLKVDLI